VQQVLHGHLYSSTLTVHACIHLFHRGRARARQPGWAEGSIYTRAEICNHRVYTGRGAGIMYQLHVCSIYQ